jgi:hypothetical protein
MNKTVEEARRAYATLDFIEDHPDKHNQHTWVNRGIEANPIGSIDLHGVMESCGTTACYAGWTVLLNGESISGSNTVNGTVYLRALDLLGLTPFEGHILFYASRDLAEVRKAVFEIFGPRPEPADEQVRPTGHVSLIRTDGTSGSIPADDVRALTGYIEQRDAS